MQTEFYRRLQNGTLNLPPADENVEGLNFFFVADEAFAVRGTSDEAVSYEEPQPRAENL